MSLLWENNSRRLDTRGTRFPDGEHANEGVRKIQEITRQDEAGLASDFLIDEVNWLGAGGFLNDGYHNLDAGEYIRLAYIERKLESLALLFSSWSTRTISWCGCSLMVDTTTDGRADSIGSMAHWRNELHALGLSCRFMMYVYGG